MINLPALRQHLSDYLAERLPSHLSGHLARQPETPPAPGRSVAMTADLAGQLREHLLRPDGQEDVCLAIYRPSTGATRTTAVLSELVLPQPGERRVHGNASFTGDYVVRAATAAAAQGGGLAVLHSHPRGAGWQGLSAPDADAESSYAYLAHTLTGLPLVGMTLAGRDGTWSARSWTADGTRRDCSSVRVVGRRLQVSWNDHLVPVPQATSRQVRTVSAWGPATQQDLARLRVLVVGAGSVGLDVALRLAASGVQHVAVMDFDTVEPANLDRLIGATRADARRRRSKVAVALRLMVQASTADAPQMTAHALSVCTSAGLATALDYDVIFSCVDRPWPRGVLNTLAYADLIPVIDGGIAIDAFDDGSGMRNATWRTHVLHPGRPCLVCNGQLDPADITTDKLGLLDDPQYIAGADPGVQRHRQRQNVATLSAGVSAGLLAQFVSLTTAPGGLGEPGPLQFSLSTHTLEHLPHTSRPRCPFEADTSVGDRRVPLVAVNSSGPPAAGGRNGIYRSVRRLLSVGR